MKVITVTTPDELMGMLRGAVQEAGTQKDAAHGFGISEQYLSDILLGRREISNRVANKFGLERAVVFVRRGGVK